MFQRERGNYSMKEAIGDVGIEDLDYGGPEDKVGEESQEMEQIVRL